MPEPSADKTNQNRGCGAWMSLFAQSPSRCVTLTEGKGDGGPQTSRRLQGKEPVGFTLTWALLTAPPGALRCETGPHPGCYLRGFWRSACQLWGLGGSATRSLLNTCPRSHRPLHPLLAAASHPEVRAEWGHCDITRCRAPQPDSSVLVLSLLCERSLPQGGRPQSPVLGQPLLAHSKRLLCAGPQPRCCVCVVSDATGASEVLESVNKHSCTRPGQVRDVRPGADFLGARVAWRAMTQFAGSLPRVSDSVAQAWGPRICHSNKLLSVLLKHDALWMFWRGNRYRQEAVWNRLPPQLSMDLPMFAVSMHTF